MSREIKCRARDKANEEYLYSYTFPSMWQFFKALEVRGIRHFETEWFTGLCDKNGLEVYEGDILHMEMFVPWVVVWNKAGFYVYNLGDPSGSKYALESSESREVIGNIFESPPAALQSP